MSILKLDHVSKAYKNKIAVDDVSLDLKQHAFVVLVGPSGCGKTTLLNIIAGFEIADSGLISLCDQDISTLDVDKRELAMVFQSAAIFDHMSVFENIAFGISDHQKHDEIKQRVYECAKLMKIETMLKRKATTLSGGEKQRVAIARALIRKPKLFLMDEPLSALDARLKNELRIELAALYNQKDTTFLYVTHDQIEAMTLADCLIVMRDGAFQQIGAPTQVYADPNNLFTASFLGKYEINQFKGTIHNRCLYWHDQCWKLDKNIKNQEVIIAVREQFLYVDEFGMSGIVVMIEDHGDSKYYHIKIDDSIVVMKEDTHKPLTLYQSISIVFNIEDVFLFNVDTEERIYFL